MPETTVPGGASVPQLRAHLAVPPVGEGPWPGVVVVHAAFGLTDDTRQQADRLAAAGYLAVAPDLFSAGGAARCLRRTFGDLLRQGGPAFGDLEATRRWLGDRPDCTGRVGVLGFCMGGGFALLGATRGFDVAAPNYGMLPRDAERVLAGACPVVAGYGRRDRALRGAAQRLERVLTEHGVPHDVREYPDAGHSFMNRHNSGPFAVLEQVAGLGYHHPSAEDAWARILRFFEIHLRAG
ncbi:dienelactone hydrolase family protein [Geodermatophilus sp. DF01-2]|uniref:dienelactone hydrolase family protein n=1 Tax=Geodermatophilus sp. DF01-2 TaxID=2559610 RepID=UPI0010734D39|nr:dienelactone hydrolase family protein [Geodermatophilus sp. DF01_2]TFV54773.1 dienelactone hydrolase family protein [Geodermatophilus sp. DF01_2]